MLKPVGVTDHRADRRIDLDEQLHALRFGRLPHHVYRGVHHGGDVDLLDCETKLAADDARDVEQIVDEASLRLNSDSGFALLMGI